MTWNRDQHVNVKGLYLDRKMVGILSVFLILGVCLVFFLIIATNTLSGLRAYSTMQGHWTESRVKGTHELTLYLETGNPEHLDNFKEVTTFIREARVLRNELISDSPDYDLAEEKLLAIHTKPRDINKMITTFKRFHTFDHFSNAIETWENANSVIEEVEEIAAELKTKAKAGGPGLEEVGAYREQIRSINRVMENNRDIVTASLSAGTHVLQLFMIWLSVSMGLIFMLSGGLLTYRFLNRIKVWAGIVEVSEQRYKSLFEHNPNAVFSLTKEKQIVSGNDSFTRISGYTKEDINYGSVNKLIVPTEQKSVLKNLERVFEGNPHSFETEWVQKSGDTIPVHLTILPIYIDDKIEGAFVIAEDISYQKYAEDQIQLQLEEKVALLSEVHDRVKNNLALMSGMLLLQESYIEDETAKMYLESTISRINSMALVHEKLYQTEKFASVRVDKIIPALLESVRTAHQIDPEQLNLEVETEPMTLGIKKAIPFGLLLNELVSNAFRYAFEDRRNGTLSVTLVNNEKTVDLIVKDDGPGLPESFEINSQPTLGMTLIRALVKQLGAEIYFNSDSGTEVRIHFKESKRILRSA